MRACLWVGLWLSIAWTSTTRADVIFDVEDVSVLPGQTAVVGVFVSGSGEDLNAYDLPIEIGNNAFGLPAGITGFSVVNRNTFSTVTIRLPGPPDPPFVKNFEAVFADSGTPITLTSTPRRLFDLLVTTDASLAGTTPLSVFSTSSNDPSVLKPLIINTSLTGVANSSLQYNAVGSIAPGRTLSLVGGSITAVPEPHSLMLLTLPVVGAVVRRRRRMGMVV